MQKPKNISYRPLGIASSDAWLANQYRLEAAFDTFWFRRHPDSDRRFRPALRSEIVDFDLPPGSMVLVHRASQGVRLRQFWAPVYEEPLTDVLGAGIIARLMAAVSAIFTGRRRAA